jgi:putative ABC transport system permease protein
MRALDTVLVAGTALGRSKTRSLLTILGVIIGVAAVIAMVSIGEGAKVRVAGTFQNMGTDMLIVSSGSFQTAGARSGAGTQATLTWDDLDAISQVPTVSEAAPQMRASAQILSETTNWQTLVVGTTPSWFDIRNWPLESGEIFTPADVKGSRKVALLGRTVARNLFGEGINPIGQTVRINKIPFQVLGVLAPKGNSPMGSDQDDTVIIPSTTLASKIAGGLQKYLRGEIVVRSASSELTSRTKADIEALLRERHRIRASDSDDFTVRDLSEIASAMKESTSTITSLLAGVALVSLIVGGIGIMNIMLVSVTERTREIGLRMAVGATPANVLGQFLVEAAVLSIVGGLLGIAAGIGGARYLAGRFGFPSVFPGDIIVLAVAVSALVGIVFGLFPALKASRLDPIGALHHE